MNLNIIYICFFIATFTFNLLQHDQQDRIPSSSLNKVIYSGFLQSQSIVLDTEKIILSCKFKSMNRKSTKSPKLKDTINKIKI